MESDVSLTVEVHPKTDPARAAGGWVRRAAAAARRGSRLAAVSGWALVAPMIGGMAVVTTLGVVGPWLRSHGSVAMLLLALAASATAGVAVVPTYGLSLLGGWAFGPIWGTLSVWTGLMGASVIAYCLARRITGEQTAAILARHERWRRVRAALLDASTAQAALIVFLLRLPPGFPFAMSNALCGAMRVPWRAYLLGTAAGLVPRVGAVVYVGSRLSELSWDQPTDWRSVAVSVAVTVGVLVAMSWIAKRALERATDAAQRA